MAKTRFYKITGPGPPPNPSIPNAFYFAEIGADFNLWLTDDAGVPHAHVPAIGSDAAYEHDQAIPATLWTVVHNLGKIPSVTVINSANEVVEGFVDHIDTNNLTIEFNAGFSGKAHCN